MSDDETKREAANAKTRDRAAEIGATLDMAVICRMSRSALDEWHRRAMGSRARSLAAVHVALDRRLEAPDFDVARELMTAASDYYVATIEALASRAARSIHDGDEAGE